ncbi:FecR domain-containing protein [Pontibacter korlensis]|uniref:Iron dicitrate transport regulator FecR n=1 Tax=Pontibacter korlensis TaxID=400092 RepID=A0A0E3ZEB5_9BACT|nr:FecR domain-containing protein [Pontibacter korlensis]AKD03684.1 hypothetical protein PKOR_11790 [Pontibacter korlensis]
MSKEKYWQQVFHRYLQGEASQKENNTLQKFILYLEQNQNEEAIWNEIGEPDEEIKRRIQLKITLQKKHLNTPIVWYKRQAVKIAATILLILASSAFLYTSVNHNNIPAGTQAEQFTSVLVAPGQQKELVLPDGSRVKLNSGSELKYSASEFGSEERRVYLKGEAFFEVKRDTMHAFVVETQGLTTRVLGTSFNINTHDSEHAVTVATGLVEVSEKITGKANKVLLHPSEKAIFNVEAGELQKLKQVSLDDFAWTERILVLQDMPLHKAIDRVERWYGVEIAYNSEMSGRRLTARYENETLEDVMQSLSFLLDLTWEKTTPYKLNLKNPSNDAKKNTGKK